MIIESDIERLFMRKNPAVARPVIWQRISQIAFDPPESFFATGLQREMREEELIVNIGAINHELWILNGLDMVTKLPNIPYDRRTLYQRINTYAWDTAQPFIQAELLKQHE